MPAILTWWKKKKKSLASQCSRTTSLFEPPLLSISTPSTPKQNTLTSAMFSFMQPSSSKAWLWSSCSLISWFGNPCSQWSMLLASSSLSLDHHQVPSSRSCTSVCSPPISASLACCKFKQVKRRTEYAIRTCCVVFNSMVWSLCAVQVVKAKFDSRRRMENSPCGEKARKTCIPSRISSCASCMSLTSCENKLLQHGHEIYLQSFTHDLHLEV